MNKGRKAMAVVIVVLFVIVVLGFFVYQNNKPGAAQEQQEVVISPVDEVVLRDLDRFYPPTPKEVLKYYSEITTCLYQTELTEEDLRRLAQTARKLYDEELCMGMTEEEYVESLREDVLEFNSMGVVVSGYTISSSTDVEEYQIDGREYAKLYVTYRLRQSTEYIYTNEVFVMRRDESGHWKILGWQLLDEDEVEELQSEQIAEEANIK